MPKKLVKFTYNVQKVLLEELLLLKNALHASVLYKCTSFNTAQKINVADVDCMAINNVNLLFDDILVF